jgi:hypothetical protein
MSPTCCKAGMDFDCQAFPAITATFPRGPIPVALSAEWAVSLRASARSENSIAYSKWTVSFPPMERLARD